MNNEETKQKKKNRQKTSIQTTSTATNSETREIADGGHINKEPLKPLYPLAAKDSEWVDILQTTTNDKNSNKNNDEEVLLQHVECEDGPQTEPLALMFPGLLEKDPEMLEGMLNKAMSTTEVTKYLVGQKANFAFMKKVNRLIPTDKKWLESLTEDSTSCFSMESKLHDEGLDDLIVNNEPDESLDSHKL
ncbi:uncharacterized protein LOC126781180 [Nymphalis io]|uniref:uncharacterized protein LOC126781180 n=1 Tax=Inachis io TaxID=171585 RepID=UPI00216862AA|nr:uncharacterized protein LOC126781180 [Nymphalis io]